MVDVSQYSPPARTRPPAPTIAIISTTGGVLDNPAVRSEFVKNGIKFTSPSGLNAVVTLAKDGSVSIKYGGKGWSGAATELNADQKNAVQAKLKYLIIQQKERVNGFQMLGRQARPGAETQKAVAKVTKESELLNLARAIAKGLATGIDPTAKKTSDALNFWVGKNKANQALVDQYVVQNLIRSVDAFLNAPEFTADRQKFLNLYVTER